MMDERKNVLKENSVIWKIFPSLVEIIFLLSLVLLGKFKVDLSSNMNLPKYQFVVAFFWMCGVLKFGIFTKEWKSFLIDSIKALVISIIVIPTWYYISGEVEGDFFEETSTIIHFVLIMVLLIFNKGREKYWGKMVYITLAFMPILILLLIKCGLEVLPAVIISAVLVEIVNYYFYRRNTKLKDK